MFASGMSYSSIARHFGTTATTVRCWLDPKYADHCRERVSRNRKILKGTNATPVHTYRCPPVEDIAARLAEIPPDTRTLTQRLCGDPLPQRSALYKMQSGNA
ncbi:hypothetical protein ASE05_16035 [Mesorhizobium sp. Root172]|nr:hypothetical protein ASE05_16035 [Mesorhizobium sp. Root172]